MNGTERKIQPEERRRSAEARQFSEDRMQLLDTVREMIDIELERYGVTPQTVLKVSARVEKSVPLYRGDNEFSILTGGTFTFKTVSPYGHDAIESI